MITSNTYFVAALVGVLIVQGIDTLAELLNLSRLNSRLPPEFAHVHDADTYAKSQRYTRLKTRFGLWSAGFDLAVLLAFWLAGGFGWLDNLLRGIHLAPILTGLLFFVTLGVAREILDLPFSLYRVFVIEQRFGFNRTTRRTFVLDLVKGTAVSAILGLPLLAGFLAVFQYLGWYAWLVAWGAGAVATLVMQILLPTFILPLFNTFTPLEEGELRSAIFSYAAKVGYPLTSVYVVDASRRSSKGNAYFTGFGKSKKIALFDTIVARHPMPELVAVLAHEIGHYKKKHVLVGTLTGIAQMGLFLEFFSILSRQDGLFAAFGVSRPSLYVGVPAVAILLRPLQFVLSVGSAALSRHNERQADSFAVATTGGGADLADGLLRLSTDSLSNLTPHPFYVLLHYSHPPVLERVRRLRGLTGPIARLCASAAARRRALATRVYRTRRAVWVEARVRHHDMDVPCRTANRVESIHEICSTAPRRQRRWGQQGEHGRAEEYLRGSRHGVRAYLHQLRKHHLLHRDEGPHRRGGSAGRSPERADGTGYRCAAARLR